MTFLGTFLLWLAAAWLVVPAMLACCFAAQARARRRHAARVLADAGARPMEEGWL